MKFSTKLTLLFSVYVLIIVIVISSIIYTVNVNILEKHIKDRLENEVFHTMDKIDEMLFDRYMDIKLLANDPIISLRDSTPKQITERLREYQDKYKFYASLSFFDLNRVRVADTSGIDIGKQHQFAGYWKDITEGREFVINLDKSISLNKIVIHFVQVVRDKNGIPSGVVVSRMFTEILYDITRKAVGIYNTIENDFTIELVDKNGLIIYSNKNREDILKKITPDWEIVEKSLKAGLILNAVKYTNPKEQIGEEILAFAKGQGYLDFKGDDWILIIYVPTKIAFAPIIELRIRIITISLIISTFALLIIYFSSRKVSQTIERMRIASDEITKGNLDVKIEITSKDETGYLAKSFNKMVADLKTHREKLLAYSNELEIKVKERAAALMDTNKQLQLEIAEHKQTEYNLKDYKKKLETIINSSRDIISLKDKDFRYVIANKTHEKLFNIKTEDIIGKTDFDFSPKEVAETCRISDEEALKSNKSVDKEEFVMGRHFHVIKQRFEDMEQKTVGVVAVIRDITERKKIEEELEKIRNLKTIGVLAGGIAHDFNNLLTALTINLFLMKKYLSPDTEGFKRLIETEDVCKQATELSNMLLTFATGGEPIKEIISMAEILEGTTNYLMSRSKNIVCKFHFSDTILPVKADKRQIKELIKSIVSNAIEAMPNGGVINVRGENINISEKDNLPLKEGKYLKVSIEDQGIGIPDENLPKIFDPYFSTKDKYSQKGMGLGLSISYSIVKRHNGLITVDSKLGVGTTFHIYLSS